MRRITALVLAILLLCVMFGCVSQKNHDLSNVESQTGLDWINLQVIDVRGHLYIVVDSKRQSYGGGVSIIHAEHCPCKWN